MKVRCPYHKLTREKPKLIKVKEVVEGENQYQRHYLKAYYECQDCQQIFYIMWFMTKIEEGQFC